MNTPNKLTLIRMIMVPFFLISLCADFEHSYLVALVIFCLASITDYFDGMLARKHNLVTDFGKFLDPIADKMLTTSALLGFISMGDEKVWGAMWVAFITLFREFIVSGIRLSAVSSGGAVIAANIWGKLKTVCQMAAIIFIIFVAWLSAEFAIAPLTLRYMEITGNILLWISAILTVISGVIYVVQNVEHIDFRK